jgi:AcrR family transcriptional regulator
MPRAERERLILDVAGQHFASDGYHAASMEHIAAAAGVSKPMVYAYFGSKDGLYAAYIHRTGTELVERLAQAFGDEDGPPVQMRHRVEEFLHFVEEHRDGWRVLFSEANSARPVAEEVAGLRGQIVDEVRRLVAVGAADLGPLSPRATEAAAHAVVGAGESLANWWLDHPEVPIEQVAAWYTGVVGASVGAVIRSASGFGHGLSRA